MQLSTYTISQATLLSEALVNHNATTAQFCGIHASEFMADLALSMEQRAKYEQEKLALKGRRQQVKNADLKTRGSAQRVVRGILCDPQHGPDSPLYVEAGFIAHNQRRSGLKRGATSSEPAAPTGQAPSAAGPADGIQ